MFCKTETGGNVVSWESAQLNITGLNTDLINREETCPGPQNITHFMAFYTKLNFHDSIREVFIKKTSVNNWTCSMFIKGGVKFMDKSILSRGFLNEFLS